MIHGTINKITYTLFYDIYCGLLIKKIDNYSSSIQNNLIELLVMWNNYVVQEFNQN